MTLAQPWTACPKPQHGCASISRRNAMIQGWIVHRLVPMGRRIMQLGIAVSNAMTDAVAEHADG